MTPTRLFLALCLGLAGAGTASAHPHTLPPPLSFDLQIRDDAVDAFLMAEVPVLEMWQDGKAWQRPRGAEDTAASLAAFLERLVEHVEITIDGVLTPPEGLSLEFFPALHVEGLVPARDIVGIKVRYKTETAPKAVRMVWTDFTGSLWENEVQVPSLIESGRAVDTALLTPAEPEYTWRRRPPEADWSKPVVAVEVGARPSREIPVGKTVAILLIVSALVVGFAGVSRGVAATLFAVCGGLALVVAPLTIHTSGGPGVLPTESQAVRIFQTLHENVYRAFDAEAEDEIYDLLAVSVEPRLLDGLYGDIFESLTLRKQGGVVCRIEDVEAIERSAQIPDEAWAEHFEVEWHWRVHGAFHHLGHTHRRINVYRARYVVAHDGQSWKIHDMQVLEYRPIDEDAEGNLPDLDVPDDGR